MTPTIHITITPEGFHLTMKRLTRDNFGDAIASLKRTVSPNLREYEPDTKMWFVADAARTQLDRWLGYMHVTHGVEAEWTEAESEQEPTRTPDAFATLHLLPTAPPEVVKAAYRALAVKLHPDKPGGDTQAMQTIIAAYEQLAA